jgi:hypothetical protein
MGFRSFAGWLAAAALGAGALVAPQTARADVTVAEGTHPVTAKGKGIAGGILLGAEIVMIPVGAAGVDKWYAYLIGGLLGGAAGGVGGYFVETKATVAEPSLYMLAGGLALVIPTVVVTMNATSYKPEVEEGETASDQTEENAPEVSPDGEPAGPGVGPQPMPPGTTPPVGPAAPGPATPGAPTPQSHLRKKAKKHHARAYIPPSPLGFDFSGRGVAVRPGMLAPEVKALYSAKEIAQFGVTQGTEVAFPVLSGRF